MTHNIPLTLILHFSIDPNAYANLSDNEELNATLAPLVDRTRETQQAVVADLDVDDFVREVRFLSLNTK